MLNAWTGIRQWARPVLAKSLETPIKSSSQLNSQISTFIYFLHRSISKSTASYTLLFLINLKFVDDGAFNDIHFSTQQHTSTTRNWNEQMHNIIHSLLIILYFTIIPL